MHVVYGGYSDGVYDGHEMIVSAQTIEWVGYDWHRFIKASSEEVSRWTRDVLHRFEEKKKLR